MEGLVELLAVEQDAHLVAASAMDAELRRHVVGGGAGKERRGAQDVAAQMRQPIDVVAAHRERRRRPLLEQRETTRPHHDLFLDEGLRVQVEDHAPPRARRHRDVDALRQEPFGAGL